MIRTIDECFWGIQNGANIKQSKSSGGFPITRIETIADNKFNRDRVGYAGITDVSSYESYILEDEDLLMSHINSAKYLGRTVLYNRRANEVIIHGMNLLRLRANKEIINPSYAKYLFSGCKFKKQVSRITKKSVNQASFTVGDLKKIKISVPSILEQVQIVEKLDKIAWIIELRQAEIKKAEEIIKARFIEMFGEPSNERFQKKKLKETCRVITGNTPSRAITDYYGTHIEWVKTDNIVSGKINPTKATEGLSQKGEKVGRVVEKDAILMVCIAGSVASIGRVCITNRKVSFNQQINAVVTDEYNVIFLYVLFQLSKTYLVSELNMSLKGILSKSKLEDKEFIMPPIEMQNEFADFVMQIAKSKAVIEKSLKELETLQASLMQKYFS